MTPYPSYSMQELIELTGVPYTTIRYYRKRGLLDPAYPRIDGKAWGPEHVKQIREIRKVIEQNLTLDDIRDRLNQEQMSA